MPMPPAYNNVVAYLNHSIKNNTKLSQKLTPKEKKKDDDDGGGDKEQKAGGSACFWSDRIRPGEARRGLA